MFRLSHTRGRGMAHGLEEVCWVRRLSSGATAIQSKSTTRLVQALLEGLHFLADRVVVIRWWGRKARVDDGSLSYMFILSNWRCFMRPFCFEMKSIFYAKVNMKI